MPNNRVLFQSHSTFKSDKKRANLKSITQSIKMKTNYRNGIRIDKKTTIDECHPDDKYHRFAISVEKLARGKIANNNNCTRWIFLWNVVYLFADEKLFGRGPATIFPAPFRPRVIPAPAPKDAQDCQELHNAARQMKHFRGMRSAPTSCMKTRGSRAGV